jgi:hypothetical protein
MNKLTQKIKNILSSLEKYSDFDSIYFFAVDNRKMNWKVGRTSDIVQRLRNY